MGAKAVLTLSLALLAGRAGAAEPTLDELVSRLTDLRKQKAELLKAEAAVVDDLRTRFEEMHKRLADLGVVGPAPLPPAPPPKPVDVLKEKLKAAFDADRGKADDAHQLAELYRQAGKLAADPAVPSTAELLRRVREAGVSLVGSDVLKAVRQVVAEELRAALGKSTDEPITGDERKKAAELFGRLADVLGGF